MIVCVNLNNISVKLCWTVLSMKETEKP